MKIADLSTSVRNIKALKSSIKAQWLDDDVKTSAANAALRRLNFEAEIASRGLPLNYQFIVATRNDDNCDAEMTSSVSLYPRPLIAEIVVFENVGTTPIEIDNFVGSIADGGLRPSRKLSNGSQRLALSMPRLEPQERSYLAQKLMLIINDRLRWLVSDKSGKYSGLKDIRLMNFDYGPEMAVSGFQIAGEQFTLAESSANFLSASLSSGEGSCPFVFAFNDQLGDWVNHQKILHYANDVSLEESDTKTFKGLRTRFRLAELEAEVAHIDGAHLEIFMKDGTSRTLASDVDVLAEVDKRYARLFWGEEIEFQFKLPEGVKPADVERSVLHVTGYYDRYSKLLAQRSRLTHIKSTGRSPFQSFPGTSRRCSSRGS